MYPHHTQKNAKINIGDVLHKGNRHCCHNQQNHQRHQQTLQTQEYHWCRGLTAFHKGECSKVYTDETGHDLQTPAGTQT